MSYPRDISITNIIKNYSKYLCMAYHFPIFLNFQTKKFEMSYPMDQSQIFRDILGNNNNKLVYLHSIPPPANAALGALLLLRLQTRLPATVFFAAPFTTALLSLPHCLYLSLPLLLLLSLPSSRYLSLSPFCPSPHLRNIRLANQYSGLCSAGLAPGIPAQSPGQWCYTSVICS